MSGHLAFHLAVERTTLEITRLYDAVEGDHGRRQALARGLQMDASALSTAHIGYLGVVSKQ